MMDKFHEMLAKHPDHRASCAPCGEAPVDALWAAYAAAGPSGDKAVAFRLGVVHYAPGQRSSQDAFPPNRPINIMHLSVFSDGWKSAKAAR